MDDDERNEDISLSLRMLEYGMRLYIALACSIEGCTEAVCLRSGVYHRGELFPGVDLEQHYEKYELQHNMFSIN